LGTSVTLYFMCVSEVPNKSSSTIGSWHEVRFCYGINHEGKPSWMTLIAGWLGAAVSVIQPEKRHSRPMVGAEN
jgi:hypothetical protein